MTAKLYLIALINNTCGIQVKLTPHKSELSKFILTSEYFRGTPHYDHQLLQHLVIGASLFLSQTR